MKKVIVLSVCIILLTMLLSVSPNGSCSIINNNIVYVDDDNTEGPWDGTIEHPYQHIQDGIDNASSGDTVFVSKGTYREHVLIPGIYHEYELENKTINLTGENTEDTILDGTIWIAADRSNITGFTIQNSSWGLRGIFVTSNYNTITKNIVDNCGDGIWLCDWYEGSNNNNISNNTIINNWRCGIKLTGSSNNIKDNIITNNWDAGIEIGFGSSTTYCNNISGNTVTNNAKGIYLWSSNNIIIYNNIFNNNGVGIFLRGSDNYICRNNIINNKGKGVILKSSSNNTIYRNKILNNKDGISLRWVSENNNITTNIISNNTYGIWLVIDSDNNIIYNNNIIDNNCGIYLSGSSYTQVMFNNFRNNKINSFFVNCNKNSWNGNYWNQGRAFPKPILGIKKILGLWFPQINFDWRPTTEPYNI